MPNLKVTMLHCRKYSSYELAKRQGGLTTKRIVDFSIFDEENFSNRNRYTPKGHLQKLKNKWQEKDS